MVERARAVEVSMEGTKTQRPNKGFLEALGPQTKTCSLV